MGLARIKKSYVARHRGTIARGVPRIYNVDRNVEIVGYAEVNQLATSVMGRVKTHRGYFYCDKGDVDDGDLILDREDERYYLVMSAKAEKFNYETVYFDSTLFLCDALVSVFRFGGGARDGFGRPVSSAPTEIASEVRCMASALNFDVMQQEDRLIAKDKLKFYLQKKVGVCVADRLVSSTGRKYVVESVDDISLTNLSLLSCDTDVR